MDLKPPHIAFNRAAHGSRELAYVKEALTTHVSGDGPFGRAIA